MRIQPEISGASVVLVGSFNPAIFTPAWFGLQGLLPKTTVEAAELEVAHASLTKFFVEWLRLEVRQDRFQVETLQDPMIRLQDLVVRLFGEFLPHTPITALGINRDVHFRVGNAAQRDRIGRTLAPTGPWGEWGRMIEGNGNHGGMVSVTMMQQQLEARPAGDEIKVTVEPSVRLGAFGVYVRVNDHYTSAESGSGTGEGLVERLPGVFEGSLARSEDLIDQVMSLAETGG